MKLQSKVLYQEILYCLWADVLSLSDRTGAPLMFTSKGQADHEADGEVTLRVRVTIEEIPLSKAAGAPSDILPTPSFTSQSKRRRRRKRR